MWIVNHWIFITTHDDIDDYGDDDNGDIDGSICTQFAAEIIGAWRIHTPLASLMNFASMLLIMMMVMMMMPLMMQHEKLQKSKRSLYVILKHYSKTFQGKQHTQTV